MAESNEQLSNFNASDTYILSLDPESPADLGRAGEKGLDSVYEHLNSSFTYGLYTDGFISQIASDEQIEVPIGYVNKEYYRLGKFPLAAGADLEFNYDLAEKPVIPILVGYGLEDEYPVGTKLSFLDPALGRKIDAEVSGVLDKNFVRSNQYAHELKQYHNFSVIIPVTQEYIAAASPDFKLNGLLDLVLTATDASRVTQLQSVISEQTGLKLNHSTQGEVNEFREDGFRSSLIFLIVPNLVLLTLIVVTSVWNAVRSFKAMIRESATKPPAGFNYSHLNALFYRYYGMVLALSLVAIIGVAALSRLQYPPGSNPFVTTYGVLDLIPLDWQAVLVSLLVSLSTVVVIAQLAMHKIRRVPITGQGLQ